MSYQPPDPNNPITPSSDPSTVPPAVSPNGVYSPIGYGSVVANSQLAIWSMVLAIASFACSVITVVPAIIFGHIALSQIKSSNGTLQGKGFAVAGLIVGYVYIALAACWITVMASVFSGQFDNQQSQANSNEAKTNAQEIYTAIKSYSKDHNGAAPDASSERKSANDHLRLLFAEGYCREEYMFYVNGIEGSYIGDGDVEGDEALSAGENSFGYIMGRNLSDDDGDTPLLIAPVKISQGKVVIDLDAFGGNVIVLTTDGRVDTYYADTENLVTEYDDTVIFKNGKCFPIGSGDLDSEGYTVVAPELLKTK